MRQKIKILLLALIALNQCTANPDMSSILVDEYSEETPAYIGKPSGDKRSLFWVDCNSLQGSCFKCVGSSEGLCKQDGNRCVGTNEGRVKKWWETYEKCPDEKNICRITKLNDTFYDFGMSYYR